jgi:putative ABC transport system permease protein
MRLITWIDERRADARFAFRQLRRAPGFTAVAVLTLALGIGANSAIFAVADATFFRPLPFTHAADRLMMVWESREGGPLMTTTPLDYHDWVAQNRTFDAMAAMTMAPATIAGPDGTPEQVPSQSVTLRFFDVLGVRPLLGRTFVAGDMQPNAHAVVIGEGFWRQRLGADPDVIGRELVVGGRSLDIVGVVPAAFQLTPSTAFTTGEATQLWVLFEPQRAGAPWLRLSHFLFAVGRLKPGVTLETAQADMTGVAARIATQFPASNKGHSATLQPIREAIIGPEARLTSFLLLGTVAFVLLMCCANVASLLVAQASSRRQELAVRAALGAGRARVAAQLATESLVLASLGGLCAIAVTAALLAAVPSLVPAGILPSAVTLSLDARVLAACALTTLAVGILFGLAPAWQGTRGNLVDAMTADTRATRRGGWIRSGLVSVQVAAAVLVLCGAGLLLRTLITLQDMDSGARATDVLTGVINLPMPNPVAASPYPTPDAARQFYDAVEQEVRRIPGVRAVAWGSAMPLDGMWSGQAFAIVGDAPKPVASRDMASYHIVTPSYFETLGVPIVAGRGFTMADSDQAPPVGLVSEAFVARYLKGRDPLGVQLELPRITFATEPPRTVQIVGVVRQVKVRATETEPMPQVYVPMAQNTWWQASLIVRPERLDATALTAPIRAAVARVDRERAVARVRTMRAITEEATSRPRFRAVLVGAFALLALTLASVGVFGVLTQSVQQRMREFGVRVALGASRQDVVGLVVHHAARITIAGVAAGLLLALTLGRLLATLIYPVAPTDPLTFGVVPVIAILTAAAACIAPAWRATRADPAKAFRDE